MPHNIKLFDHNACLGMWVHVYRNLHNGAWSVRHKGRVIGHTAHLMLENCVLHVNQKARERAVLTGKRTVHAYIKGRIARQSSEPLYTGGIKFSYNPFKAPYFYYTHNHQKAAVGASQILLIGSNAYIYNPNKDSYGK